MPALPIAGLVSRARRRVCTGYEHPPEEGDHVSLPQVVSREEWVAARKQLLTR